MGPIGGQKPGLYIYILLFLYHKRTFDKEKLYFKSKKDFTIKMESKIWLREVDQLEQVLIE